MSDSESMSALLTVLVMSIMLGGLGFLAIWAGRRRVRNEREALAHPREQCWFCGVRPGSPESGVTVGARRFVSGRRSEVGMKQYGRSSPSSYRAASGA